MEPLVIIGSGILGALLLKLSELGPDKKRNLAAFALPAFLVGSSGASLGILTKLVGVFLKAGFVVFGTGLAVVPLLKHDVVDTHHWLTNQQFMDALAFGQITPGPVLITSTFIGYKVAGLVGAAVATAGVFFPGFFNILTWFPIAERKLGNSPYTRRFVLFAVGAVIGSILVTVARLAAAPAVGGTHTLAAVVGGGALLLALFTKIPVWLLIPGGGALSIALQALVGS